MEEVRSLASLGSRSGRSSSQRSSSQHSLLSQRHSRHSSGSESAVDKVNVDSMYLDTKANMLEIIEEGLQLKLEIKNIKEQFLSLLHNYDKTTTKEDGAIMQQPASKGSTSARTRVRAVYEARKARLVARRSMGPAPAQSSSESKPKGSKYRRRSDSDKENMDSRNIIESKKRFSAKNCTKKHSNCACQARCHRGNRLLTPIKEVQENLPGVKSCTQTTPSSIEGDYVTLRTDAPSGVTMQSHDDTSVWTDTTDAIRRDATLELSAHEYSGSPGGTGRSESPVKYASSDAISELYTSARNLQDVSRISRISRASLREQVSGSNLSSNHLHSTFNYPLHSTLNYPLHSTLDISGITTPKSEEILQISPESESKNRKNSAGPAHRADDSWLDIRSIKKVEKKAIRSEESPRTPRCGYSLVKTGEGSAQLCKEHGLHPTFGGPCIFQTDDSFTMSDSSPEEEEQRQPYAETDCDSSYLSECMEDFTQGEACDYTATYDARNGRMKMLKRQTGQNDLNQSNLRQPLGLSDSDFLEATRYLDSTRKHFSLEATRSSLPDLAALSTTSSEESLDQTLKANNNNNEDKSAEWDPNIADVTMVSVDRRPLSVATTTDNSPESTTGLTVPVNSPNITDSGGSSSKQTTDNYDYAELPQCRTRSGGGGSKLLPLPPRPPARKRHHLARIPGAPKSTGGRSTGARSVGSRSVLTTRSAGARLNAHRSPSTQRKSTRHHPEHHQVDLHHAERVHKERHHPERVSPARRSLRYKECDSGFSTPNACGCHITISDTNGHSRTVVQHTAVARNLARDRKKSLAKKIKQFNNNYKSTGNLSHIQTLGHF